MSKYENLVAALRAAPLQPHAKQFVNAIIDGFENSPAVTRARKKEPKVKEAVDVVRDDDPAPTHAPLDDPMTTPEENDTPEST